MDKQIINLTYIQKGDLISKIKNQLLNYQSRQEYISKTDIEKILNKIYNEEMSKEN